IEKLELDIERSRRRISFELGRFEAGIDIEKQLKKGGKKIAIFDSSQTPIGGPSGLWDRVLWSFDMYSGDMTIRDITLYQEVKKQGLIDKYIKINENALQIVLDNMVDNAVKYAYDRTEIRLKMRKEEIDGRDFCTLSIGNFGNGILETELDKVWERLYRGTYSTTRKQQVAGSGLGMFIIKEVIEYYGGKVGIDSHHGRDINYKPGEGFYTKVWISLSIF
ncbi:MAG: ATP-binding protein, partial [Planctomycetota bacterium]